MKEYLFIRYGTTPNQEVSRVMLTELTAQGTKPHLQLLPGVIITLFKTTLTESEMRGKLDRIDGILYDLIEKKSVSNNNTSTATTNTSGTPSKEQLERELNAALASEDYEKASEIRDKIAELFPDTNESMITSLVDFKKMLEDFGGGRRYHTYHSQPPKSKKRFFGSFVEPEKPFKRDLTNDEKRYLSNHYSEHSYSRPDAKGRIILGGGDSEWGKYYITEEDLENMMNNK